MKGIMEEGRTDKKGKEGRKTEKTGNRLSDMLVGIMHKGRKERKEEEERKDGGVARWEE